jgi:predicted CXXCH cytochrome family protein
MQPLSKIILIVLSLLGVLGFCIGYSDAKNNAFSEESKKCLECHSRHGIIKKFESNEYIKAYVDAEKFKASVHGSMKCSICHTDFSMDNHPKRNFKSKHQYKVRAVLSCRRCHNDEQLMARSIHASFLKEEKRGRAIICTDCHGSHYIMAAGSRFLDTEKKYCMSCHSDHIKMNFKNGETLSLTVDLSSIRASVHKDLTCSDCHFGFSLEEHPERRFRAKRDYIISASEGCRRCHFDKYTKTMESIHYTFLNQGNLNAPVCIDCHGGHSIQSGRAEKIQSGRRCEKCHAEIFKIYASSIHGRALIENHNQDVPICVDCHTAHSIVDPRTLDYRENTPEICGSCHAKKEIMEKYGLSTAVVKTYLSDFHGVTLGLYKKQKDELHKPGRPIAVCTDCHGVHNICSARYVDKKTIKANLVKKCQKCHINANENFPDAWLYHYEPNFKKSPIVYSISLLYNFLTPVIIIGLVFQILLHIWRYAVSR